MLKIKSNKQINLLTNSFLEKIKLNQIATNQYQNNKLSHIKITKKNFIYNNNNKISIFNSEKNSFNKHISKFNFSLYIPQKQLVFQKHPEHGLVYPVYIADRKYNKKSNPQKITPLLFSFSFKRNTITTKNTCNNYCC